MQVRSEIFRGEKWTTLGVPLLRSRMQCPRTQPQAVLPWDPENPVNGFGVWRYVHMTFTLLRVFGLQR